MIDRFQALSQPMRDRDNRLPIEALPRLARVLRHMMTTSTAKSEA